MSYLASVHTGYWTDWSRGRIYGQFITLRASDALLLIAFLTYLVCCVGGSAWTIVCFLLHQKRSDLNARDGLYHQRQVVLRNSSRPSMALYYFCRMTLAWRYRVAQLWSRQLPLIGISLAHSLCWIVAALFVSRVAVVGDDAQVLLSASRDCGLLQTGDTAYLGHQASILSLSASCSMANAHSSTGAACQTPKARAQRHIEVDVQQAAECPFPDSKWCRSSSQTPVRSTSQLIDVNDHLSLNFAPSDRIAYLREMTCALLPDESQDYVTLDTVAHSDDEAALRVTYRYITWAPDIGRTDEPMRVKWSNFSAQDPYHFTMFSVPSNNTNRRGIDINDLHTAEGLMPTMADLDVGILTSTATYQSSLDDGLFRGSGAASGVAARPFSAFACATTHQFCNPNNDLCTQKGGWDDIGFDTEDKLHFELWNNDGLSRGQRALIYAFRQASRSGSLSTMLSSLQTRSILLAQDHDTTDATAVVPQNQTSMEFENWFSIGLAALQQEFAALAMIRLPFNRANDIAQHAPELQQLCHAQRTFDSRYINISVLGLCLILVLGLVITAASLCLATLYNRHESSSIKRQSARAEWRANEMLSLLKSNFESNSTGTWTTWSWSIPTTMPHEKFCLVDGGSTSPPRRRGRNRDLLIDTAGSNTALGGPLSSHPPDSSSMQSMGSSSLPHSGGGAFFLNGLRIASEPTPSLYTSMVASMPPGTTKSINGVRYTALSTGNMSRERGKSLVGLLPPVVMHRDSERPASWIMPTSSTAVGDTAEASHAQELRETLLRHVRNDSESASSTSSEHVV